jgi:tetratricopeptide (TPR) repeat protein
VSTPVTIRLNSAVTVFVLLMAWTLSAQKVLANTSQAECQSEYDKLSDAHNRILEQYEEGSPSFFETLHEIEEALFTAFELCPQNALLFTLMGEIQISLGNIQLATLYAQKAYGWNDSIWQTQHLLGSALAMQEKYEEGLVHMEKAAAIAGDKPELLFNLCSTHFAAKNYQKSVEFCSKLIDQKDHVLHAPAYHIRGLAYKALNMDKKAKQDSINAKALGYNE